MVAELASPSGVDTRLWPGRIWPGRFGSGHSDAGGVCLASFDDVDGVDTDCLLNMVTSAGPSLEGLEILLTIQRRPRSVDQSLQLGLLLAQMSNWLSGQEAIVLAEAVSLAADDEQSDRQYGHRSAMDSERLLVHEYSLRTARTDKHVQTLLQVGSLGLTDKTYDQVLASGVVDETKAKVIHRAVDNLTLSSQDPDRGDNQAEAGVKAEANAEVDGEVDGATLAKWRHDVITLGGRLAKRHHWQRMERELAKFTAQLRPQTLSDRHRREYAKRYVAFIPRPSAMAELRVYGAYDQLHQVYGTLTKLALNTRQLNQAAALTTQTVRIDDSEPKVERFDTTGTGQNAGGVGRTDMTAHTQPDSDQFEPTAQRLDQLRYDELIAALTPATNPVEASKQAARLAGAAARPHLLVAVNATTLAGQDDDPAMVLGGPALPAHVARRIATCATWQQLLTDPTSQRLIAIGKRNLPPGDIINPETWPSETQASNSYTPSPHLKRLIGVRDQTCRIPTCSQPAWRCEIDHIEEYDPTNPAEQQTIASNLELLCKTHHQLKTKHQWDITRDPTTGQTTITTNLGHTTTIPPATIYPIELAPETG